MTNVLDVYLPTKNDLSLVVKPPPKSSYRSDVPNFREFLIAVFVGTYRLKSAKFSGCGKPQPDLIRHSRKTVNVVQNVTFKKSFIVMEEIDRVQVEKGCRIAKFLFPSTKICASYFSKHQIR